MNEQTGGSASEAGAGRPTSEPAEGGRGERDAMTQQRLSSIKAVVALRYLREPARTLERHRRDDRRRQAVEQLAARRSRGSGR